MEFKGIAWALGTAIFGAALQTLAQPAIVGEIAVGSVAETALVPGRLEASEATDDAMKVHTRAALFGGLYHPGGYLDGAGSFDPTYYDESVAAYVPGSSGYACWVGRYFDPDDATFHFTAGTLQYVPSVQYLDEALVADLYCPPGCYRAGAVALVYGQTTVQGGRFASWRNFLSPNAEIVTKSDVDDRLVELLEDGARITRLTPMGIGGSRRLNPVAAALLKRPYTP